MQQHLGYSPFDTAFQLMMIVGLGIREFLVVLVFNTGQSPACAGIQPGPLEQLITIQQKPNLKNRVHCDACAMGCLGMPASIHANQSLCRTLQYDVTLQLH
jgi:hypothetical protein